MDTASSTSFAGENWEHLVLSAAGMVMSLFLLKLAHYYSFLLALDQLMNRFLIFRGGKKNNKCRELVPSTNRCESVRAHWVCSALWPSGTAHCCCGGHPLHLLHPGIYSAQQGRFQQGFIPFTHPVRSWVLRGDGSLGVLEAVSDHRPVCFGGLVLSVCGVLGNLSNYVIQVYLLTF